MVVRPGDLHRNGAEGGRRVTGAEDVLLPEAIPPDGRQDSHRGDTWLLQGIVSLGGDGESACCAQRLPGKDSNDRMQKMHFDNNASRIVCVCTIPSIGSYST